MRAALTGAALVAFVITPSLADYYIVQEPTSKRCRIVEERPASPGVGVIIGGVGFGVRTEAESHLRTVEECRETTGGGSPLRSVNVGRRDKPGPTLTAAGGSLMRGSRWRASFLTRDRQLQAQYQE